MTDTPTPTCVHCGKEVDEELDYCHGCHRHVCVPCGTNQDHWGEPDGTNHGGYVPEKEQQS